MGVIGNMTQVWPGMRDRLNTALRRIPVWPLYIVASFYPVWLLWQGASGELGVICFSYIVVHLLVWLLLDVQIPQQIAADIIKRPYITVGMAGFALMIPLAVTSNNWSVRKMGPKWRKLHQLTYGVVLLGGLHFLWLTKGFQLEPVIYAFLALGLLATRLPQRRKRRDSVKI